MATTKIFDPKQLICTFLGNVLLGFADGTFVNIERNEDTFQLAVGADGDTARARSNNRSGRITFTLMQTSASNDILSAAAFADESTGTGIGPCMIKDLLGRTLVVCQNAWIVKPAPAGYAKDIQNRDWIIETDFLQVFLGGN